MTPDLSTLIDHNPMQQFQKWFYEADDLYDEREPNAIALTSIGAVQYSKSSMVLLKKYTFTTYESDKGKAISPNPEVCILFNWPNSGRMIQVSGKSNKISESENYVKQSPRGNELGAWASQQSQVVGSQEVLENSLTRFEAQLKDKEIPIHLNIY